jgi:hypothetical protein
LKAYYETLVLHALPRLSPLLLISSPQLDPQTNFLYFKDPDPQSSNMPEIVPQQFLKDGSEPRQSDPRLNLPYATLYHPVLMDELLLLQRSFLFFGGTGIELRTLHLQSSWVTPPVHFAVVILEMGSCEVFAHAGLQLWSSQSQPPQKARITGMNHWHPAATNVLFFLPVVSFL